MPGNECGVSDYCHQHDGTDHHVRCEYDHTLPYGPLSPWICAVCRAEIPPSHGDWFPRIEQHQRSHQ